MGEKNFFDKTKVKIALAGALAVFVATFLKSYFDLSDEVYGWLLTALGALFTSLLGAHALTDTVTTNAKIKAASGDTNLIKKVALDLAKAGVTRDPKDPS